jgi:hypothetical protein
VSCAGPRGKDRGTKEPRIEVLFGGRGGIIMGPLVSHGWLDDSLAGDPPGGGRF